MTRTLFAGLVLAAALDAAAAGRIIIVNTDSAGVGFNDPTPATPVGGNDGTTLGAQRLNVFQEAARRWQNAIDTSVDIYVSASFRPIPGCTENEAILGQATPFYWKHSFNGAPQQNIWYPAALANHFAGRDLETGLAEIFTQFNGDVDTQACLSSSDSDWYYGFDGQHGNDIDLFVVVLHELAHGLGVSGKTGGAEFSENRAAAFHTHAFDRTAGLRWDQMTTEQRRVSITNTGNVVWDGAAVRENAAKFLTPVTTLTVTQPSPVARDYDIGTASFGSPARTTPLSGPVVVGTDGIDSTSASTTDGCSALTNAAAVSGKIALVDRGNCTFVTKALNAQAAGAAGLIIADNVRTTCLPPGLGGTNSSIRIPVVSITQDDGSKLKTQLATNAEVAATLRVDPSRLAGGSSEGYVRLYAPCSHEAGSSTYHWDTVASPNLLMEPSVSSDLLHGLDLTLYQLLDIGWSLPARTGRRILKR